MEQNGSKRKSLAPIATVSSIYLGSGVKARRYVCKWTINDFHFCCKHADGSMESRHFDTDGIEWSLDLHPRSSFDGQHLSVRLYYCSGNGDLENSRLEEVRATMSIIDDQGEEVCTQYKTITKKQLALSYALIFERIVSKIVLFDEDYGLLPNNQLTLLCKIYINENFFVKPDAAVKELSNCERLLEDQKFSDVRIVVGNKTFHAHRAVLSARSPVFAAMFSHELKEQKDSKIDITDFDEEVMGQLLFFIYSGGVELDKIKRLTAGKLFAAANKYEIAEMKMRCEQALIENLEVDNVAEVLQLADKHGSETLREAAFAFLRKRRHGLACGESGMSDEEVEAILSSLSPAFLAKVIRSLMDELDDSFVLVSNCSEEHIL